MTPILMADDDKHFLQVVSRFLAAEGYQVATARNGQEALAAARASAPELVILDVALPLVTGDQVARELGGKHPILFISGRDLDRLEDLPGDRYRFLRKPADLDEILEAVRDLLAGPSLAQ